MYLLAFASVLNLEVKLEDFQSELKWSFHSSFIYSRTHSCNSHLLSAMYGARH